MNLSNPETHSYKLHRPVIGATSNVKDEHTYINLGSSEEALELHRCVISLPYFFLFPDEYLLRRRGRGSGH